MLKCYLDLKYRTTDTTSVVNKCGRENVHYNGCKKRRVTATSIETEATGVPIKITVNDGNEHDSTIFLSDLEKDHLVDSAREISRQWINTNHSV